MAYKASDMANLMKRSAQETIGNEHSAWIYYGTVVNLTPLRVLIDDHEQPLEWMMFEPFPYIQLAIGARLSMLAVNNHQKFLIYKSVIPQPED